MTKYGYLMTKYEYLMTMKDKCENVAREKMQGEEIMEALFYQNAAKGFEEKAGNLTLAEAGEPV